MDGETEAGLGIGVLRQERDTDTGYQRCWSVRDADTEECGAERVRCQYEERRDADAEEGDNEWAGMRIPRESNSDAEREQCQCWGQRLPGNDAYNSTTISMTG